MRMWILRISISYREFQSSLPLVQCNRLEIRFVIEIDDLTLEHGH